MKKDQVFISNLPLGDALKAYEDQLAVPMAESCIHTLDALNRKTSRAVFAKRSSPSHHCAAMDGIAVRAADTHGANERNPITLTEETHFIYVNTGNLMPQGMDAVIMIEDIVEKSDGNIEIIEAAYPWQHIRQVGEDIIQGEMILPSEHIIRPMDLGALIQGGISDLFVHNLFRIGILPTGNEIVQDFEALEVGKIMDSNSRVLEALIKDMGAIPTVYPVCPDDVNALKGAMLKGIEENDLMLTIAGSSAGKKDFTADIIRDIGEVIVHGVAIKPGKPTILGKVGGKGIIGLPGYPVSCYLAFQSFVTPILELWSNQKFEARLIEATTTQKILSSVKHEELIRVTVGEVYGKWVATPLNREAGATMSLVRADGLMVVPRLCEGMEVGALVQVKLLKPIDTLKSRLVIIGSHDPLIDILSDHMPLASTHVGSFGGIMALRRRECHLAPIHLIDEATGEYNLSATQQYFKNQDMMLIRGFRRLQGLYIKKGNPKQIQGIEDLIRSDIEFVNRQKGAGTRQLLDFELKKRNLSRDDISGYQREVTTHTAVAVAVASDSADVGMGVLSAAKALDLDFIPIGYESYDFLTYPEMMSDARMHAFIKVLKSDRFQHTVTEIGGYEMVNTGDIIEVGDKND